VWELNFCVANVDSCFFRLPACIRKCRRSALHRNQFQGQGATQTTRNVPNSNVQRMGGVMAEQIIESLRRLMEQSRENEGVEGAALADRKEYIENVLMTKNVELGTNIRKLEESFHRSTNDGAEPSLNVVGSEGSAELQPWQSDNDNGHECCAICLSDYQDGDVIGWSHNKNCKHIFHRECISEWLLTHEECPCCRHYYLFFMEDGDLNGQSQSPLPPPLPAPLSREEEQSWTLERGLRIFYNLTGSPSQNYSDTGNTDTRGSDVELARPAIRNANEDSFSIGPDVSSTDNQSGVIVVDRPIPGRRSP
jgi:hypothetical protein